MVRGIYQRRASYFDQGLFTVAIDRNNGLDIGPSTISGRGVFARWRFDAGETIEVSPVLLLPAADKSLVDQTSVFDYYFDWENSEVAIALGYVTLCNHSSKPNSKYVKDTQAKTIRLVSLECVEEGQEVTVEYQNGVWFSENTT